MTEELEEKKDSQLLCGVFERRSCNDGFVSFSGVWCLTLHHAEWMKILTPSSTAPSSSTQ